MSRESAVKIIKDCINCCNLYCKDCKVYNLLDKSCNAENVLELIEYELSKKD